MKKAIYILLLFGFLANAQTYNPYGYGWFKGLKIPNTPTITTAAKMLVKDANNVVSEQLIPSGVDTSSLTLQNVLTNGNSYASNPNNTRTIYDLGQNGFSSNFNFNPLNSNSNDSKEYGLFVNEFNYNLFNRKRNNIGFEGTDLFLGTNAFSVRVNKELYPQDPFFVQYSFNYNEFSIYKDLTGCLLNLKFDLISGNTTKNIQVPNQSGIIALTSDILPTNIGYAPALRQITSSTGSGAVLPIADGNDYGLSINDFTTSEKIKLSNTPTTFFNGNYSSLIGVPSTFTPTSHTHTIAEVTNLQSNLDAKQNQLNGIGLVKANGTTITYDNTSYLTSETDPLALKQTNNLSDLTNVTTARTNLGLGTLATSNATIPTNTNQLTNGAGFITSYAETDPIVRAVNGIVKSNGTTITSAVAGTDYALPNANTTGTASNITGNLPQSQVVGLATSLSAKEDVSNKAPNTSLGTSNVFYPTQNAVKVYVDTNLLSKADVNHTHANATTSVAGFMSASDKVKLDTTPTSFAPINAEQNVNADWNATSGDAQILNKPIMPSVTNLVPYTGANQPLNLGIQTLTIENASTRFYASADYFGISNSLNNEFTEVNNETFTAYSTSNAGVSRLSNDRLNFENMTNNNIETSYRANGIYFNDSADFIGFPTTQKNGFFVNSSNLATINGQSLYNGGANITIAGGATNLGYTPNAINGTITNSNGTTAIIPLATTVNAGLLEPNDKVKLNNTTNTNSGDNAVNVNSNGYADNIYTNATIYADAKVQDFIDVETTIAPSANSVKTALANKENTLISGTTIKTIVNQSLLGSGNIIISKTDVGLPNIDNTTDLNKPISTATQTALNLKQNTITLTNVGTSGNATLVGNTLNIPNYTSSGGSSTPIENEYTMFTDFIQSNVSQNLPYVGAAISSGTAPTNVTNINVNHPGVIRLSSSATANSGFRYQTDTNTIRIGGNEVFKTSLMPITITNSLVRAGFHDATTTTDAVDGVYFEMTGAGVVVLKSANNNTRTTSATVATLAINNWYTFKITVNPNATSVLGELFNSVGTLLGSQTITTNIPTSSGREVGAGVIVTNSGTVASGLIDLDYIKTVLKPVR